MTIVTKENGARKLELDEQRIRKHIQEKLEVVNQVFEDKMVRQIKAHDEISGDKLNEILITGAIGEMDEADTGWQFVAARKEKLKLYKTASKNRGYHSSKKYGDFYKLVTKLVNIGIYSPALVEKYTESELKKFGKLIDPTKDNLFTHTGLHTLASRYLVTDFKKNVMELPQERWLVIALTLMQDEKPEDRAYWVSEAYWALSNLYMTVATPTLANAGRERGQWSSCFVDMLPDSLDGIYNTDKDFSQVSKYGGGMGIYAGKVRSRGSAIAGFKGASSGILPWVKQINNTAVAVDQLGQRQGAVAVYLDVWHKDINIFLDLKLNNGDERLRAHDIFTGVCIPDIFMEAVDARKEWHLFDPHEVRTVMGYSLEDSFDEKDGEGTFRTRYEECVNHPDLSKDTVQAIDIMKRIMRSQLETGTPYMFYRDEVNRKNPNKHAGIVYSSNLCSEIMQNMSVSEQKSVTLTVENGEELVVTKTKPGDYVVCNLSSVNLGKAVPDEVLERLIPVQVRMLDNVIDLNDLPVAQAKRTNSRYRGIGLGTFGWHHLLALNKIHWESDEAVDFADKLYEQIAYLTIKESMNLAKERGAYPLFEGSDWETGQYFIDRGYTGDTKWDALEYDVQKYGVRNGYMMAVAPNSSTSVIAGSTSGIDPVFKPFYHEEKKNFKLPVSAPDLDHNTYDVYRRSAYIVDQRWSIKQNAKRQRHVDQAISFNLFVPNNIKASRLLELHMLGWKLKLKTTYYTRSTASDIDECEWCHS